MQPELSLEKINKMSPYERQNLSIEDVIQLVFDNPKPPKSDYSDKLNAIIRKVDQTLEGIAKGDQGVPSQSVTQNILLSQNNRVCNKNKRLHTEIVKFEERLKEVKKEKQMLNYKELKRQLSDENPTVMVSLHVENCRLSEEIVRLTNKSILLSDEIYCLQEKNREIIEDNWNLKHDVNVICDENKKLRTLNMRAEVSNIKINFQVSQSLESHSFMMLECCMLYILFNDHHKQMNF